jgi:hypothetical protein
MGKGTMMDSIWWTLIPHPSPEFVELHLSSTVRHERRGRPERLPWQPSYVVLVLNEHSMASSRLACIPAASPSSRQMRWGEDGLEKRDDRGRRRRQRKVNMQRGGLRGVVYLRRHCSLRRRKDLVRRWHPLPSDSLQSPDAIVFSRWERRPDRVQGRKYKSVESRTASGAILKTRATYVRT